MTRYAVEVTEAALEAVEEHVRYIAVEAQAPLNAARWLDRILGAAASLEQFPKRGPLAEEDAYVGHEVRHFVVGNHLLLFSVDEERKTVWVLGLRHARRLARPGELPEAPRAPDGGDGA